jgi:hypothetical protein
MAYSVSDYQEQRRKSRHPNPAALEATMSESLLALLRAERDTSDPIVVPIYKKPHPLVATWPKPQKPSYGLPWFTAEGESRRRRIASALFQAIEQRGGKVSPNKENEQSTHRFNVTFFSETIEVSLDERLAKVKIAPDPKRSFSYETTEWHPTGRLRLRLENYLDVAIRREWNDNEKKRLEERLREILIAIYIAIEAERLRNERLRKEDMLRAEAQRERWEREQRERIEREAVQELLNEAKAWEDARRIRDYVTVARKLALREPAWLDWALGVADRLDPIKAREQRGCVDERKLRKTNGLQLGSSKA